METGEMSYLIARFLKDESGATAIEYGLIAALISVAIVGGLSSLGSNMDTMYTTISAAMK
jgi:pilus assembly protein Flp/PilA